VFKSDFYDMAPFHKVLGKCCVLFVKDYFKSRPEVSKLLCVRVCTCVSVCHVSDQCGLCLHGMKESGMRQWPWKLQKKWDGGRAQRRKGLGRGTPPFQLYGSEAKYRCRAVQFGAFLATSATGNVQLKCLI